MQVHMKPLSSSAKQSAMARTSSHLQKILLLSAITFILFFATAVPDARGESSSMSRMGVVKLEETIEAPGFTLPDISGNRKSLSDFNGEFVMLNFWATWWPYCDRERSSLEAIHQRFKDQGLVVLAVSLDQGEQGKVIKRLKKYVSGKQLSFPNLLGHPEVAGKYGVRGIPMNVFINPQGQIVGYASGYRKWDSQKGQTMIEQLLQESRYTGGLQK